MVCDAPIPRPPVAAHGMLRYRDVLGFPQTSKLKLGKPPDRKWVMKEDPQGTGPSLWER